MEKADAFRNAVEIERHRSVCDINFRASRRKERQAHSSPTIETQYGRRTMMLNALVVLVWMELMTCQVVAYVSTPTIFGKHSSAKVLSLFATRNRRPTRDQPSGQPREKQAVDQEQKSHFFSQKPISDPSFSTDGQFFRRLCVGAGIERPSKIQSMAWPVLLNQQHAILGEQTGSGKTLAYLIPLLQHVVLADKIPSGTPATPRLLILAPTAELADQIAQVCKKIAGEDNLFSSVVLTATGKMQTNIRDQMRMLTQKKSVDVLISTPGRVATILRTKKCTEKVLDLSHLHAVVMDEVDVLLLDDTFGPQLQEVGQATQNSNTSTQFVFVTATLPDSVVSQVKTQFADVQLIKGPGLHRVAPNVQEKLMDVSVPSSLNRDPVACFNVKARALNSALRQNRCRRTLVFCNTVSSCRQVENLLQRADRQQQIYNVCTYHNAMTSEGRNENLAAFAQAEHDAISYVLVCTDRAARGVDFDAAAVDHVIIFDFPVDPAEYVRRVGRTARAGRDGQVTLMAYGWQLPIARSIMGKQLKGYTNGATENYNGDDGAIGEKDSREYRGGVKGRKRQAKNISEKNLIRGNIAGGKLWSDR